MSIKTSKRIALGVITALVFAPFAAIAPASANGTATNAFITDATTVAVGANAAVAVSTIAATPAGAPGVSVTAGVITNSISALTVPASTVIGFRLRAVGGPFATPDTVVFSVGGQSISTVIPTTAQDANHSVADFTAPSVAGTYAVILTYNRAGLTAQNNLTLTVAAASSGLTEFALSNDTSANALRVSAVSVTKKNPSGRVGVPAIFHPAFTATINAGTANTTTTTTRKANLRYTVTSPSGTVVATTGEASITASVVQTRAGEGDLIRASNLVAASYSDPLLGTAVQFVPTVAGNYVVTIWHDANNDSLQGAGEAVGTATFTALADATPNVTVTQYGSAIGGGANDSFGKLVRVCLTNGTEAAGLSSVESLAVSFSNTTTRIDRHSVFTAAGVFANSVNIDAATLTLNRANFNGAGCAYMNVYDSVAAPATSTMTLAGAGGSLAGYSNTAAVAFISSVAVTGFPATALAARSAVNFKNGAGTFSTDTTTAASNTGVDNAVVTFNQPLGVSTAMNLRSSVSGVSTSLGIRVVDTSGVVTGLPGAIYVLTSTTAATATGAAATLASFTVTAALGTGESYQMIMPGINAIETLDGGVTVTVVGQARAAATVTTTPSLIRAVVGANSPTSVQVNDQFGDAMANIAVTPTIAGRNATVGTPAAKITDAAGRIAFDFTDASTSTVLLQATVTFTTAAGQSLDAAAKTGTFTVNYGAAVAVATVTVTGGASADIAPAKTESPISTAVAGPDAAGLVTMTAVLKDAAGNTLPAGVPVSWTTSLANTAIVNNVAEGNLLTTYTNGAGSATTKVFSWKVGTTTVTATAGGKSATGTIHFINAVDDARVLSGTVSGNLFTAKVVDRYGNPVKGVNVTATRTTGPAVLQGTFPTSASQGTIADGTVTFATTGGAGTFKLEISGGQSTSAAGKVGATTITVGSIGESLAPAGVPEVSVTIAAPVVPPVVVPPVVYDNPTLSFVKDGGRIILSGTAVDGEGDIIIYTKKVGTTAWKERAKTLEVAAPGDFNGSIKVPKSNVLIRVKQEGTGQFSNQVIVLK